MKELSMEEKAKAYDETIEKLRNFYRDYDTVSRLIDTKEELANLFPELKEEESEDERIRKWLIEMVEEVRKANPTNVEYNGNCSDAIAWLEKQGEQKPVNKVEPKFKVKDWVVFNNRHDSVYQVEKIENYEYTLRHFLGGSIPLSFSHEDMIKAWTIQDAKNGDVLVKNSYPEGMSIFIFKKFIRQTFTMKVHCSINYKGQFLYNYDEYYYRYDVKLCPATIEQRNTLMKAIADAAYTFDFEKKELKKVEPKSTDLSDDRKIVWFEN